MYETDDDQRSTSSGKQQHWALLSRLGAFGVGDLKGSTTPLLRLLPSCPAPHSGPLGPIDTREFFSAVSMAHLTAMQFLLHDLADLAWFSDAGSPPGRRAKGPDDDHDWTNLRSRPLSLGSVFPSWDLKGDFARMLQLAMIWPQDRARMWLGTDPAPNHGGQDLLRLHRIATGDRAVLTEEDIFGLPPHLRTRFFDGGDLLAEVAIIPDNRNEHNLLLSQFHARLVAYHNHVVARLEAELDGLQNRRVLYRDAQKKVIFAFQAAILQDLLPAICNPKVLEWSLRHVAPVYRLARKSQGTGLAATAEVVLLLATLVKGLEPTTSRAQEQLPGAHSSRTDQTAYLPSAIQTLPRSLFLSHNVPTRLHPDNLIDWSKLLHPTADWPAQYPAHSSFLQRAVGPGSMHMVRPSLWIKPDVVFDFLKHEFDLRINRFDQGSVHSMHNSNARSIPLEHYLLREMTELGERTRLGPLASLILSETIVGLADEAVLLSLDEGRTGLSDLLLFPHQARLD